MNRRRAHARAPRGARAGRRAAARQRARGAVLTGLAGGLAVLLAISVLGCGHRKSAGNRAVHSAKAADSSFAALTFERGRTPRDLSVARGQVLYARYCSVCHGETGGGDGFNAYNIQTAFDVMPTAFSDSAVFAALAPDSALAAIRMGGPAAGKSAAMPPWGRTLTPGEVIDVWNYAATLRAASAEEAQPEGNTATP